jgi:hypothetical protein
MHIMADAINAQSLPLTCLLEYVVNEHQLI